MSANMRVLSVTSWIILRLGKQDQSRSELKSPGLMMTFVQQERSVVNWSGNGGKMANWKYNDKNFATNVK